MPVKPRIYYGIILVLVCVAAYWSGLDSPFLFDSSPAISKNPALVFDAGNFMQWYNALFSSASGPTGRLLSIVSDADCHCWLFSGASRAVGLVSGVFLLFFKSLNLKEIKIISVENAFLARCLH